jgi:mitochondrial import receptor subunit TOM40
MRFEITKPLNQNFFLSHSLFMGNMELGTGGRQVLKAPIGTYEFGANVISEKYMMLGRIATDGRLSGRLKADILDWVAVKLHMQLSNEPGQSQVMADTDIKGRDWNAQVKLGSPTFLGLNYFQSVTPQLSAGGEFFWLQSNLKSGVGLAVRHTGEKHVGTLQLATTGIMSMGYAHKVTEKITLASDFLWHWQSREATATVGFDCMLRQCRLRGKIDTNGVVSTYVEERFAPGINFVLSAEIDHPHGNHRYQEDNVEG